jgi:hypothetical protein
VLNLAVLGAVTTSGAPYEPYNDDWDGATDLRALAATHAETTVAHEADVYATASTDTVVFVVAPQEAYTPTERAQMRQFVQRGGTVIIASSNDRTNDLLSDLDVEARVAGALLRDEQENYRNASLPVATNVAPHRYTEGVDGVTLNYGSALNVSTAPDQTRAEWQGEYVVNSSQFAYLDRNRNEQLDDDELLAERPVVGAESIGQGDVLIVSDASVVTNAMLERDGNQQFVTNIVTSHDRVVLDYSHGPPLPPVQYALLVIRSAPRLQFLLGIVAVGGVTLWVSGLAPSKPWLPARLRSTETASATAGQLDADELAAFLATEHPDWEADRIQRVTEAIIRRREQSTDDD